MIDKNKVVALHYRLTDVDGAVLEDSQEVNQPLHYLHGHNGLMPPLEQALQGKNVGDKVSVTLEPADAFGEVQQDATQRVSINHVLRDGKGKPKLKPGMVIQLNTKNGPRPVTVVKAGLKTVDVDLNHPFAGKSVTFNVEVLSVRDASDEEIEHGHVHGEGGVHHH
ncbi:MAG: peptidylprolyl isomerase [Gammaproteobacteria bacterium]|nr:peptidylprolyl isomerase [Gammaproteobacteria bacterium]